MLLIVEVADTTVQYDRAVKLPLYARHDIPEVWIVNLPERRLEMCRHPVRGMYSVQQQRDAGGAAGSAYRTARGARRLMRASRPRVRLRRVREAVRVERLFGQPAHFGERPSRRIDHRGCAARIHLVA